LKVGKIETLGIIPAVFHKNEKPGAVGERARGFPDGRVRG
jgi:hypothetical protein